MPIVHDAVRSYYKHRVFNKSPLFDQCRVRLYDTAQRENCSMRSSNLSNVYVTRDSMGAASREITV